MISEYFKATLTHTDIHNKIYDEKSIKIIRIFGVKVFQRKYIRNEVIEKKEKQIGFKK